MLPQRYYMRIEDFSTARGADPEISFDGASSDAFAAALLSALNDPALFNVWRAKQPDPDTVDESLGALDKHARVSARPSRSGFGGDVELVTTLPSSIIKHRMRLLVGSNWALSDVRPA